jgi:hypothetical protein
METLRQIRAETIETQNSPSFKVVSFVDTDGKLKKATFREAPNYQVYRIPYFTEFLQKSSVEEINKFFLNEKDPGSSILVKSQKFKLKAKIEENNQEILIKLKHIKGVINNWVVAMEVNFGSKKTNLIFLIKNNRLHLLNFLFSYNGIPTETFKGSGIGHLIMSIIKSIKMQLGLEKIILEFVNEPDLISFYEKEGLVEDSSRFSEVADYMLPVYWTGK